MNVLYEDNHLLAVAKPPGLPTQGAVAGKPSLVSEAKEYLRRKYRKPGNVYLGVVSRLDSAVSGVVVFARTSKAAARLNEQFRGREVEKTYWALVEGQTKPVDELVDWIVKDERQQRMITVPAEGHSQRKNSSTNAKEARLSYRRLKSSAGCTLIEIRLETGRKHQIRVQLAARGHPVIGDSKYGSRRPFSGGIALHSRRLVVEHPVKKTPIELVAPLPRAWKSLAK
jgi:23S rRNA pseudouridine1911/1915/1917 synthase